MIIIDRINGFRLCKDSKGRDLYQVIFPSGADDSGNFRTRDEVLRRCGAGARKSILTILLC